MTDMTAEQALKEYIEGTGIKGSREWEAGFRHGYNEGLHQALIAPMAPELVYGDQLPSVGSKVLIHLSSKDAWVEHTVAGYYAWADLAGDPNLHRVFVQVWDAEGRLNARILKDVRHVTTAPADDHLQHMEMERAEMHEAKSLAMSMWRKHYKDVSPNFELCDSVVGVITQIDNMAAGLSEKIVERDAELAKLQERVRELESMIAGHNADITLETDLSKMAGDYPGAVDWTGLPAPAPAEPICKRCGSPTMHVGDI